MRIHFLEHDTYAGDNNIDLWARSRGHRTTRTFMGKDDLPPPGASDLLIVTGFTHSLWETDRYPWLIEEKAFVREALEARRPTLGLCFGAQLLAELLGGEVFANDRPEFGWHEIHLTPAGRKSALTTNLPDSFYSFHWHGDHFTLPPDCECLAHSEVSPNQAYISHAYPAAATQFHPEYTRALILTYLDTFEHGWPPGPTVQTKEEARETTKKMPETLGLMESLLEGLVRAFSSDSQA